MITFGDLMDMARAFTDGDAPDIAHAARIAQQAIERIPRARERFALAFVLFHLATLDGRVSRALRRPRRTRAAPLAAPAPLVPQAETLAASVAEGLIGQEEATGLAAAARRLYR
jgi:hypothetical protein